MDQKNIFGTCPKNLGSNPYTGLELWIGLGWGQGPSLSTEENTKGLKY